LAATPTGRAVFRSLDHRE